MFEIGNSLREARHRRSIEFAQAEQATKVRGKYLSALEDERFDLLPSETYVKGFLRTYADYLGLDGQMYVDEFNSRFVVGEEVESRIRRSSAQREPRSRRLETSIVLFALGAIAVVTIVVISAWKTSGGDVKTPKAQTTHKATTPAAIHAYLEITGVTGSSFAVVRKDGPAGAVLFSGTIEKNGFEPFNEGESYWVNVSSPENLSILVGGKTVHVSGGRPSAFTVTPTGWHVD